MDPSIRRISIPLVRRALQRIFEDGWLPIQPMITPNGLIYYWRRRFRRTVEIDRDPTVYTSDAELIRQGHPYIYVKECENVCCSIISYGDEWIAPDVQCISPSVLDQEAHRTAAMAQVLADTVMDMAVGTIVNNMNNGSDGSPPQAASFGDDYHIEDVLLRCKMERDKIEENTYSGRRPGHFWAILPLELQEKYRSRLRLLKHRLKLMGFRVHTRKTNTAWNDWNRECHPMIVIGFKGDKIGDNGFISAPHIPVSLRGQGDHTPRRLTMRWGHKLLREGVKFFGGVRLLGDIPPLDISSAPSSGWRLVSAGELLLNPRVGDL